MAILFLTINNELLLNVLADNGMAELKALTGDTPYLGTGNYEQAPEYFGSSLYRNYYDNGFNGDYPGYGNFRNRYHYNSYITQMRLNNLYGNSYYNLPYRRYYSGQIFTPSKNLFKFILTFFIFGNYFNIYRQLYTNY